MAISVVYQSGGFGSGSNTPFTFENIDFTPQSGDLFLIHQAGEGNNPNVANYSAEFTFADASSASATLIARDFGETTNGNRSQCVVYGFAWGSQTFNRLVTSSNKKQNVALVVLRGADVSGFPSVDWVTNQSATSFLSDGDDTRVNDVPVYGTRTSLNTGDLPWTWNNTNFGTDAALYMAYSYRANPASGNGSNQWTGPDFPDADSARWTGLEILAESMRSGYQVRNSATPGTTYNVRWQRNGAKDQFFSVVAIGIPVAATGPTTHERSVSAQATAGIQAPSNPVTISRSTGTTLFNAILSVPPGGVSNTITRVYTKSTQNQLPMGLAVSTPTVQVDPGREVTATQIVATALTPTVQVDPGREVSATATASIDTPTASLTFTQSVTATEAQLTATATTDLIDVIPEDVESTATLGIQDPSFNFTFTKQVTSPAIDATGVVGQVFNQTISASVTLISLEPGLVKTQFKTVTNGSTFAASVATPSRGKTFTVSDLSASAEFPQRLVDSDFIMARFPEVSASMTSGTIDPSVISTAPSLLVALNTVTSATPRKIITRTVQADFDIRVTSATYPSLATIQVSMNAHTAIGTQVPFNNTLTSQVNLKKEITKIITITGTGTGSSEITGGKIDRDVEAAASFEASVEQSSGSVFEVVADIDGIGSISASLSQRFFTEADIDGVATIGAPLLKGADIVTIEEIWNVALVELGITTVSSSTDNSPQALLLSNVWNGGFRQQFLADHAFHGAKTTKSLSLFTDSSGNTVKPSGSRWSNAYELPTDYIRALTINGLAMQPNTSMGQNAWEIEIVSDGATVPTLKRCLLSNEGSVSLEYIMDVGNDNISLLSPLVAHACGLALAAHVATNFGKNPSEQQQLNQKAQDALLAAKGADGQESSPRMFSTTSLLDVRR